MKPWRYLFIIPAVFIAFACNDAEETNSVELESPANVQPPAESIPDSMQLLNDSVIVPDASTTQGDTLRR